MLKKERPANAPRQICPWTHLLTFRDSDLEEEFRQAFAKTTQGARGESCLGALLLLAVPVKHFLSVHGGDSPVATACVVFLLIAWLLTLMGRIKEGFALRFPAMVVCLTIYFAEAVDPASSSKFRLALQIFNRSALVSFALGTSGYRPFIVHAASQLLGTVISGYWVAGTCMASTTHTNHIMHSLGSITETILSRFATLGFPMDSPEVLPGRYPCAVVVAFLHTWSGIVVPLAMYYLIEVKRRAAFLGNAHGSGSIDEDIHTFLNGAIILGCVTFLIATQLLWFGFTTAAKLVSNRGFSCHHEGLAAEIVK